MATKIVMEALSPTMEEGRLVEWKKNEGDAVAVGDVIAEVETDKAVMELVARVAGTLIKQEVEAGATVPVSDVVGWIGEAGEKTGGKTEKVEEVERVERVEEGKKEEKAGTGEKPEKAEKKPAEEKAEEQPAETKAEKAEQEAPAERPASAAGERVKASPLARRIATERGVDLSGITGSGPAGRIVQRDVEAAKAGPRAEPATAPAAASGPTGRTITFSGEPFRDEPLSQIRKTIAKRLVQSIGPIPTFYLTTVVDMERATEAREALNALGEGKVSFNDIIMKATALALVQHPACNAWWQDDHIRYWNEVHLAMAVALDEGLITPVIRHADQKSLREIAAEAKDLAGRARERKLKPEEYTGGTFSVSNLGMLDIDEFTAVINPPEAGIIAIGRISENVVPASEGLEVRKQMKLTMSCDHRVIDGATGAVFLRTLKRMLENPLAMVY